MATGIVSVAASADHADAVSAVLAIAAAAVYVLLLAALVLRVVAGRAGLAEQLRDPTAALVFPLGMYSAATYALRARTGTAWLGTVATVFLWIAVAVLVVVVAAPMRGRLRTLRPRSRSQPG